jgi:response regulator RpfG family c-di-GMP phosphodiesterase
MAERILIVDHDEVISEIISALLTPAGYECAKAESGVEALAMLGSGEPFDLILTEVILPGLDGIGLLERIGKEYPDTTVVICTGVSDPLVALACFRHGAWDYLRKPFERKQLEIAVRLALINHRRTLGKGPHPSRLVMLTASYVEQLRETLSEKGIEDGYDEYRDRLTAFIIAVARALGLPSEQIKPIARAAALRQIGQVPVLLDFLSQPDGLRPDELDVLRRNCHDIYQVLKSIPFLAEASEIIYAYQERFDGTGQPRGLKGAEIPLGARILCVTRTLGVPASPSQANSSSKSQDSAFPELQRGSGKQFDPDIVDTILAMPRNIWGDLIAEVARKAAR